MIVLFYIFETEGEQAFINFDSFQTHILDVFIILLLSGEGGFLLEVLDISFGVHFLHLLHKTDNTLLMLIRSYSTFLNMETSHTINFLIPSLYSLICSLSASSSSLSISTASLHYGPCTFGIFTKIR